MNTSNGLDIFILEDVRYKRLTFYRDRNSDEFHFTLLDMLGILLGKVDLSPLCIVDREDYFVLYVPTEKVESLVDAYICIMKDKDYFVREIDVYKDMLVLESFDDNIMALRDIFIYQHGHPNESESNFFKYINWLSEMHVTSNVAPTSDYSNWLLRLVLRLTLGYGMLTKRLTKNIKIKKHIEF